MELLQSGFTHNKNSYNKWFWSTSTGSFGLFSFSGLLELKPIVIQGLSQDTMVLVVYQVLLVLFLHQLNLTSDISGSFTSGFGEFEQISGSVTSTGSFGRVDGIVSITGDAVLPLVLTR